MQPQAQFAPPPGSPAAPAAGSSPAVEALPEPSVNGDAAYPEFARELVRGGLLSDPWLDGQPRFERRALRMPRSHLAALSRAAEQVIAVYDQVVRLCVDDPGLRRRFFPLSPWQERMWHNRAPLWHGIARADAFFTDDGLAICELNCDTPSGEAEAVLLARAALAEAARERPLEPPPSDPSARLEERFCRLVSTLAGRRLHDPLAGPLTVGLVYPTELTEDLSMIALYRRWLEARGAKVVLGSPFNLAPARGGRVALFGAPLDLVVRHYKTDWLGERLPARDDEPPLADAEPLWRPLSLLLSPGAPPVVNPFASILPQNKRSMALMWEELARFPSWAQRVIRRHVPYTVRLETLPRARLRVEKDGWVIKSDYGCEGAEVLVGREVTGQQWRAALDHARPGRFVAQRFFHAVADGRGEQVNHGVYLVAGVASGLFSRVQRGRTDRGARAVATLIDVEGT